MFVIFVDKKTCKFWNWLIFRNYKMLIETLFCMNLHEILVCKPNVNHVLWVTENYVSSCRLKKPLVTISYYLNHFPCAKSIIIVIWHCNSDTWILNVLNNVVCIMCSMLAEFIYGSIRLHTFLKKSTSNKFYVMNAKIHFIFKDYASLLETLIRIWIIRLLYIISNTWNMSDICYVKLYLGINDHVS